MADESLSQTDIDLLLSKGLSAEAALRPAAHTDAQLYDFRRPRRVSKERQRTLEGIYDRFAKALDSWLLGRVRRPVETRLVGVEQCSFGEFTLSLPAPCATFGFDVRDGNGHRGAVDVGYSLASLLVDRLFGGSGAPLDISRGLTPIERLAIRTFIEHVIGALTEVWRDYVHLPCDIAGFEFSPDMVQLMNREEPVLVATMEVSCDGVSSLLIVCLPFLALDNFFSPGEEAGVKGRKLSLEEQQANHVLIEASLRRTSLDVAARLPTTRVRMAELLRAVPGQVLRTNIPAHARLEVFVSDNLRFHASPGRVNSQIAVRILDPHESIEPSPPPTA